MLFRGSSFRVGERELPANFMRRTDTLPVAQSVRHMHAHTCVQI